MPYRQVAQRVCEMMQNPNMASQSRLVVDATGLGAPVIDLLRDAGIGGRTTSVTITGGEQAHGSNERWSVPKKDLLTGLEILLESGELIISSQLKDADRLLKELQAMHRASSGSGKVVADGPEHDDLALALALACWRAKRPRIGFGNSRAGHRFMWPANPNDPLSKPSRLAPRQLEGELDRLVLCNLFVPSDHHNKACISQPQPSESQCLHLLPRRPLPKQPLLNQAS